MNQIYHVSKKGNDAQNGTEKTPFLTISKAAEIARSGDTIIVHEGEYREWVKPNHAGHSTKNRITYKAAKGEAVVIKGSEIVSNWENVKGTVWKVTVDNVMFGTYNPYKEEIFGDWLINPDDHRKHTGEVYLNGKSLYEAKDLNSLENPTKKTEGYNPVWKVTTAPIRDTEGTLYQWFAEVNETTTDIYANFQDENPNEALTEINVRKCCFYPEKISINYITVDGFEMAHAALPWAPPTADQPGLLGTHWSKGWIIENNRIHDAKCSAISIGKEISTGHNYRSHTKRKSGYQYQMESVFDGLQKGWTKDAIGSHIIRNNTIYDSGQNGIVGHMGCAFSEIYDNHIYNIGIKHEYFGYEIACIKFHAAIDAHIHHNRFDHSTLGVWLDWQAQGVRVNHNLFYENDRDFMIEVTHGPCLLDHNIFLSKYSMDNVAQGTAFVNNLFTGTIRRIKEVERSTPYHYPHSTTVAGVALVYGADDRVYNNIFVGGVEILEEDATCGTDGYDMCPDSYEKFIESVIAEGICDEEMISKLEQPVYIDGNAYLKGAKAYKNEKQCSKDPTVDPQIEVIESEDGVYVELTANAELLAIKTELRGTANLGIVRIADAIYDDKNGNDIDLNEDYFGQQRGIQPKVGPFETLKVGKNKFKVWG